MRDSLVVWVLKYLRDHENKTEATCREIFKAQHRMDDHYAPMTTPIVNQVLEKHGYTREQWSQVLEKAFHWLPLGVTEKDEEVNKDIKEALTKENLLVPILAVEFSYMAQVLNQSVNQRKNPKVQRYMGPQGVWVYSLKKR